MNDYAVIKSNLENAHKKSVGLEKKSAAYSKMFDNSMMETNDEGYNKTNARNSSKQQHVDTAKILEAAATSQQSNPPSLALQPNVPSTGLKWSSLFSTFLKKCG